MLLHRTWRKRAFATTLSAAAATATVLAGLPAPAQAAALTGTITITSPIGGKVAADTAKQVILLTVAGQTLSEALVTSVDLGEDTDCQGITSYVVTSPTTIAVKTPTGGCAATSPALTAGDNIVINFAGSNTLTKTGGLFLINPPAIAALSDKPIIADNSSQLQTTNQVQRFVTNGGQIVRVKADSTYAFDPRTAAGLSVTFSGKPATEVKVYTGDGTQILPNTPSAPAAGNYMTFKTPIGLNANDSNITITQNGVSKTFTTTDTGVSVVAAPTVSTLTVTSGKARGSTNTVVNGTGFSKVLTDYTTGATWAVQFCGVAGTVTAVNATGTAITVTTPDVTDTNPGLGSGIFAGTCGVRVVDVTNSISSPLTPGSYFNFLAE
ncbi:hypothetical protein Drose_37940 [Dactylosporangium roseum]|uniref:IPT/TIG domain-containing protein n=1 Tax=Dactylosporangium roseum TaxID=47989 RepID=A0ABY5Z7K4_9ACTN|nr:hypothetical protein [Dactylosporangium roseum]UWZ36708.1 hypothetical protein Drose_37940 [Dactylosporangium roseum]